MKKERLIFRAALLAVNIFGVLAIMAFIDWTTEAIRANYNAREFLSGVVAVPWNTRDNLLFCASLVLLLCISFLLREFWFQENPYAISISLVADVLIGLLLIRRMDYNYTGILLMISANILFYLRYVNWIRGLLVVSIGGYMILNYDLLSLDMNLYNLMDYINYYNTQTQQIYLVVLNILNAVNIVLFAVYCIYTINSQRETIVEVQKLYGELEDANQQLQEYAQISEKMAQTKERNRLAREIHDTLGHILTEIIAGLDACLTIFDISPEQSKRQLEVISEVARNGITDVRRSVNALRPDVLEQMDLEQAIRKMISDTTKLADVKVYFSCEESDMCFEEDEEMTIYRVIQESITNALRHGKAHTVWISMQQQAGVLNLRIKDDGIGCEKIKSGFGTQHIRERVALLNGTVSFDGSDGFLVNADIPIRWGKHD